MLMYGHDERIAEWVSNHIPHVYEGFEKYIGIGYIVKEKIVAGFIFNDYHAHFGTIQLSMAATSPVWAKKNTIKEILRYPFEQLKCYKIFTTTPADNIKALKVNEHIGFKQEAILAHQFGKKRHAVVMRMLLPDYNKFLKENCDGQI
tara:strand:- start:1191 stop:1631 length:441 start_codon:yes stop_codon:yes gene_type:complete